MCLLVLAPDTTFILFLSGGVHTQFLVCFLYYRLHQFFPTIHLLLFYFLLVGFGFPEEIIPEPILDFDFDLIVGNGGMLFHVAIIHFVLFLQ